MLERNRQKEIPMNTMNNRKTMKKNFLMLTAILCLMNVQSFAQGVGISESSITPDASAILELRSTTRGLLLPRLTTTNRDLISTLGMALYNSTTNRIDFYNGSWNSLATLASPTFTGTVTMPTPFTLGATSVTSTGTQLNYLNAASGTTGTASTNLVFSASPTFTGTVTMPTPFTLGATSMTSTGTQLNYLAGATGTTGTTSTNLVFSASPTFTGTVIMPTPFTLGATSMTSTGTQLNYLNAATGTTGTASTNVVFSGNPTLTGFSSTGAVVNINVNSNFATNINTGTSTGAIAIGNTSSASLTLESGVGGITLGSTANARTWNIGDGNAIQTVNMFNNATPANVITIGGAASTLTIGSRENTIGTAYVANGDGIRFATNRITKNYPTAPTTGLAANTVATVAQILNSGYIGFGVLAASRTLTLPTAQGAAGLVQNLPGTPAVGDVFTFMVANGSTTVTRLVTLVAGAGITLTTHAVAGLTTKVFFCRVTSITAGAETITVY
jgi:hypothetical protein